MKVKKWVLGLCIGLFILMAFYQGVKPFYNQVKEFLTTPAATQTEDDAE